MSELFLITGFLGAGKTTLLNRLLALYAGRKTAVIVNEYGQAAVDGALLEGQGGLQEIVGGSIFCVCRSDQFDKALSQVLAAEPEAVFVETSGLADPSQIQALLAARPDGDRFRFRGTICLVDARRAVRALATALPAPRQIAVADLVVVNKVDQAGEEELQATLTAVSSLAPEARVLLTRFGRLEEKEIAALRPRAPGTAASTLQKRDLTLRKALLILKDKSFSEQELRAFVASFVGFTWRVKGFVRLTDGRTLLVDGVGEDLTLTEKQAAEASLNQLVALASATMTMARAIRESSARQGEKVEEVSFAS